MAKLLLNIANEFSFDEKRNAELHLEAVSNGHHTNDLDEAQAKMAKFMTELNGAYQMRLSRRDDWMKIPKKRRDQVAAIEELAHRQMRYAVDHGGEYSGVTDLHYTIHSSETKVQAYTKTRCGDRYSRSSPHWKTNATHCVAIDSRHAVSLWLAPEELVTQSNREGLTLLDISRGAVDISLTGAMTIDKVYTATWVTSSGQKQIKPVTGWVAWDPTVKTTYHSTKSSISALRGLKKKVRLHLERQRLAKQSARLAREKDREWAKGLNGTLSLTDLRDKTGWCYEGCMTFIRKYLPAYEETQAAPVEEVRRVAKEIASRRAANVDVLPVPLPGSVRDYATRLLEILPTEGETA